MKKLQQISMAVVLTVMLATGAFAGIIHTGAPEGPPTNPPSASRLDLNSGTTEDTTDQHSSENLLGIAALNLLQMLSVF